MPLSLNPLNAQIPPQRLEGTPSAQALKAKAPVDPVSDQPTSTSPSQQLQLKGLGEVESLAWLATTDAALHSAEQKLSQAQEELNQGRDAAAPALDAFTELTQHASFQGQAIFNIDSPALESLTHLSDHPPYFMTSAGEAVEMFRQNLAEQLEAELQQETSGIPLGESLATDLREKIAAILDTQATQPGQNLDADFSTQGQDFHLQGQVAVDSQQQAYLDANSQVTTIVNGTELLLEGPFVRLLGPVSDDEFILPEKDQQPPQVGVDLQQKIDQLAQPGERQLLDDESLKESINEALSLFEEIRQRLRANLDQLETSSAKAAPETFAEAQQLQEEAVQTFASEPWAALQTQAHATPDLVLNTIAE